MLDIQPWKRALILLVIGIGLLLAMPNLFYQRVEMRNDAVKAEQRSGVSTPEQDAAKALWPSFLPSGLVNLGLDLRGGAHLLGQVHVEDVYKARMDVLWPQLRDDMVKIRDEIGPFRRIDSDPDKLIIEFSQVEGVARAAQIARSLASPVTTLTGVGQDDLAVATSGNRMTVQLSDAEKTVTDDRTMLQSLEIIRRRIDEVGTREPTIARVGADRILIQVPGIGSAEELKELIGTTAKLTFNPVIEQGSDPDARPGVGNIVLPSQEHPGLYYTLEATPVVTGEQLVSASPGFDQDRQPSVDFRFNAQGAKAFGAYTSANIGQLFAIVLDDEVISAPVIRSAIMGGSGQISGNMNFEESERLAVLLRAGALPAEMTFLEERTIGPELGQDSIEAGRISAVVAIIGVVAYIVASYGLFGVFASIAVLTNVAIILGVMSAMGATLTLPGIAGIVLTVGTAVDANVIIYERIREELRRHKNIVMAIDVGFKEAMSAIIDANLTTFIAALVMFFLGSGPVKGFAVTLTIGIATSVFTAIFFTRLMIIWWIERRNPTELIL